ncbi:MAG: penicillin-binding protein 2 [Methylohalobius sp.]|nr:penicillin-binding protein 2 [Methylohalobius sp.]
MVNLNATHHPVAAWRRTLVLTGFGLGLISLMARAFYVQVWQRDFFQRRADRQQIRIASLPAHRGQLLDRDGVPLAVSAPVQSVCVDPRRFQPSQEQLRRLSRLLGLSEANLKKRLQSRSRAFVYLKRHLPPVEADKIAKLEIEGLFLRPEFKRYYPAAEVSSHLLGFTDIDQRGQEGLEKQFEAQLQGVAGRIRVVQDRRGRIIEAIEAVQTAQPGRDVVLSIDRRLQYWSYLELKRQVAEHGAKGGMLVLVDVRTGEVLALANQPAFNPNLRRSLQAGHFRNRAITDGFEPGSTLKPFALACALRSKAVPRDFKVDTHPGWLRVGRHLVRDHQDYGVLDLAAILHKSSNVGITQVALRLTPKALAACLRDFGFGRPVGIEYPGEASGFLSDPAGWDAFEQATIAFGYGISVSALQLARAYTALADGGILHSLTLLPRHRDEHAMRVVPKEVADMVLAMLEGVVSREGTALKAEVPGYRVAGKTGTAKIAAAGGYADGRYRSLFVGIAPVSRPRLVLAVVIEEPAGEQYYGGEVAAPVFARVMGFALRLLGVPPDAPSDLKHQLLKAKLDGNEA